MRRIGLLVVSVLCVCCKTEVKETLGSIHISKEILKNARPLEEFLQDPVYVPLETTEGSVLSGNAAYVVSPGYIWGINRGSKDILAFRRQTGNFLGKIGVHGRGPGEYSQVVTDFYNLPPSKIFCTDARGALMQFDVSGRLDTVVPVPFYNSSFSGIPSIPTAYVRLNDSVYVAYYSNLDGRQTKRLVLFSAAGEVVRVFPNEKVIEGVKGIHVFGRDGIFYKWGEKIFFKENANDTIWGVSKDSLCPHFRIDRGEYTRSYAQRYAGAASPVSQRGLWESERYVYFLFSFVAETSAANAGQNGEYLAVYDKGNRKQDTYQVSTMEDPDRKKDYAVFGRVRRKLRFEPVGLWDGYYVACLSALNIREHFGDAIFPENWKNVKEEDNPVLVFRKLP